MDRLTAANATDRRVGEVRPDREVRSEHVQEQQPREEGHAGLRGCATIGRSLGASEPRGARRMRVADTPEQIRAAFEAAKDDPSFDESRGLWERGQPPVEMLQAMCLRPEILRAFAGFGNSVY